ncbi:hypothetical protein CWM47_37135 [Spirosoma pollinicola]|uniref:DUF308 domain-containing protein n=1 Tax=Spirosoma pollinicola TaxID=2057025 RepID=A0A2K8ZCN6_9BACT|nr:hypothetical protein CWM47_37135 [Spirosoma pollinicola]
MDSITAAQTNLRSTYRNGATGVLVSGIVWLTAAGVIYYFSTKQGIWALLVGGALIHPISTLINKMMGLKATTNQDNPLTGLAMEGTIWMLMTIPIAYGLSLLRPEWFFQGMLLIIGGRYLTFRTLYGNNLFWLLGGLLGLSAYGLFTSNMPSLVTTLTGGFIEVCFGLILFYDSPSGKQGRW